MREDLAGWPEYPTPGDEAVASMQKQEATVAREALDKEADTAWRKAKVDVPYNYKDAYAQNQTAFEEGQPLPNEHIPPDSVEVAGFDLATGARRRSTVADRNGFAEQGVKDLKKSSQLVKFGKLPEAPPADSASLAKIAVAYLREGKGVDEFNAAVPSNWSEAHRKVAWNSAVHSENTRILAYSLGRNTFAESLPPAEQKISDLHAIPQYATEGRAIYQAYKGEPFTGSDLEASEWLTGHLRDFNLNPTMGAVIWARSLQGSAKLKASYRYASDQYERTDIDWSPLAVTENISRMVVDPTSLIGFGPAYAGARMVTAGWKAWKAFLSRGVMSKELVAGAKSAGLGAAAAGGVNSVLSGARTLETADLTGQKATTGDVANSMGSGLLFGAALGAAGPELLSAGGSLIKKGLQHWEMQGRPAGLSIQMVPGGRSHDPETGAGSAIAWAFELNPGLKMDLGQARAKASGPGITAAQTAEILPAIEAVFKDGAKTHTGAELATAVNAFTDPMEIKWITPGAPPKKFSKTTTHEFLEAHPEYPPVKEAYTGLLAARRDFRERMADEPPSDELDLQRFQLNKAIFDASLRLKQISREHLSPEESMSGFMFEKGQHSDFPMGPSLETALKDDALYQRLKKELAEVSAKPMHWDRQSEIGGLKRAIQRYRSDLFSAEELAAGRTWKPEQPRNAPPLPAGQIIDDYFAQNTEYNRIVRDRQDLDAQLRRSEELHDGLTDAELAEANAHEEIVRYELRQVDAELNTFLSENLSPIEVQNNRVYSLNQRQGRVRMASNINHLQSVGTPGGWGKKPESRFMFLAVNDPNSLRRGYEAHAGNEVGNTAWAPVTIDPIEGGGEALVPHEMQSDWAKNLREARRSWDEARRGIPGEDRSYEQLRWDEYRKWLVPKQAESMPESWTDTTPAQRQEMVSSHFFNNRMLNVGPSSRVYNQPPMRNEKTYMLDLLKASTYKAAQMGLNAVAVPDQAHISARWPGDGMPVRTQGLVITVNGEVKPQTSGTWDPSEPRFNDQFFRAKDPAVARLTIAKLLEEKGEKEAAKMIRNWKDGDGGARIMLDKKQELVPMGFINYREDFKAWEKWLKKEFGLSVGPIKNDTTMKPIEVENLDGTKSVRTFRGPKLNEKTRDFIKKQGVNYSKMENSYAIA